MKFQVFYFYNMRTVSLFGIVELEHRKKLRENDL